MNQICSGGTKKHERDERFLPNSVSTFCKERDVYWFRFRLANMLGGDKTDVSVTDEIDKLLEKIGVCAFLTQRFSYHSFLADDFQPEDLDVMLKISKELRYTYFTCKFPGVLGEAMSALNNVMQEHKIDNPTALGDNHYGQIESILETKPSFQGIAHVFCATTSERRKKYKEDEQCPHSDPKEALAGRFDFGIPELVEIARRSNDSMMMKTMLSNLVNALQVPDTGC